MTPSLQLVPALAPAPRTDLELAAACAAGDRDARAQMFERYADPVYHFIARRRGTDGGVVGDLVQATFIAAFESAKSFGGPVLRNWIFGIASNVVRSYIRRDVARRRTIDALEACEVEIVDAPESERDLDRLRAAIAALPPKLREAIVLVDLQGERGVDVAASLGVPEGTLWRRLHDARARIRVALGGAP